jgi:hypothetical protein
MGFLCDIQIRVTTSFWQTFMKILTINVVCRSLKDSVMRSNFSTTNEVAWTWYSRTQTGPVLYEVTASSQTINTLRWLICGDISCLPLAENLQPVEAPFSQMNIVSNVFSARGFNSIRADVISSRGLWQTTELESEKVVDACSVERGAWKVKASCYS